MNGLYKEYPCYDWNHNKGYPTRKHRDAIRAYGTTSPDDVQSVGRGFAVGIAFLGMCPCCRAVQPPPTPVTSGMLDVTGIGVACSIMASPYSLCSLLPLNLSGTIDCRKEQAVVVRGLPIVPGRRHSRQGTWRCR